VIAVIASISLKYLTKDNRYRTKLSNHYIKKLKENKRIFIVQHSKHSSRHLFSILVKNRENLIRALKKNNIYPGVHYKSILEFDFYKIFYFFIKIKFKDRFIMYAWINIILF
jgi:dTDP-4-amino-4,6-dideoxygalactose transaminase